MSKIILITGCSSGIGLHTAKLLSEGGYKVYATLRDLSRKDRLEAVKNKNLEILQLNVTNENSVKNAVNQIIEKEGRIDVLVNNAGYGLRGTIEEVTIEEIRQQYETNFLGVIRVIQEILPHMRKQRSGHIINISSVGGVRGGAFSDIYVSTKFALEAISESMAPVLDRFNIKVTLIEPGPVITDFLERSLKYGTRLGQNSPYNDMREASKKAMDERFKNAQDPSEVAQVIKIAIETENPHFRYQTREDGKEIVGLKLKDITGNTILEALKKQLKDAIEKYGS